MKQFLCWLGFHDWHSAEKKKVGKWDWDIVQHCWNTPHSRYRRVIKVGVDDDGEHILWISGWQGKPQRTGVAQ